MSRFPSERYPVVTLDPATLALLHGMAMQIAHIQAQVNRMSGTTDTIATELATLTTTVTNEVGVEQSAIALINGIPALIAAAVAQAGAAGATPDQLAAFASLSQQISASSGQLAAAVTAVPPAPTPAPAPAPAPTPAP